MKVEHIIGYTHKDIPEIIEDKIELAIQWMSVGKVLGQDKIAIEILKAAPCKVHKVIAYHFNIILRKRVIPTSWKKSSLILLHKKGGREKIVNYRPICLMSHMSKLFSRVLLNHIYKKLEEGNRHK